MQSCDDKDIDEILTRFAPPTQKATARTRTKKGQCGMLAIDCEEIRVCVCVWCVCVCAQVHGVWREDSRETALCSKLRV